MQEVEEKAEYTRRATLENIRLSVSASELRRIKAGEKEEKEEKRGLKGDYANATLLIFLYILQGIPLGLLGSIPLILASHNVSYEKQAIFSFATYPYSIKLLWAPIVDSLYSTKFGRRKSWLIPVQYAIGISCIIISTFSESLIGTKNVQPQIYLLTTSIFLLVFLTATQDVAVDAWALTLLARRNIHYAPSCNVVGAILGTFISNTVLLALESPDFCNRWLRSVPKEIGILTVSDFLFGAGFVFIIATTLVWIFKRETDSSEEEEDVSGVINTYKLLWKLLQLDSIKLLTVVMFTEYIGHATIDNVNDLKLIEFGMKKENLSMLKVPISVLNLFLPFLIAKKTGEAPLSVYWKSSFARLLTGCIVASLTYWTQTLNCRDGNFSGYYYLLLFSGFVAHDIARYAMAMTIWAFQAKISDPKIGATYMTLMMTIHNIGKRWPNTVSLWLVDKLTIEWSTSANNSTFIELNSTTVNQEKAKIDGFYVEFLICLILGFLWLTIFRKKLLKMQSWPESKWRHSERISAIDLAKNNHEEYN